MRILDEKGNEIVNPDLEKGYLKEEQLLVTHHDAVEASEGVSHYETETITYENVEVEEYS